MNTVYTSNGNKSRGHVNVTTQKELDYTPRSNGVGCIVLMGLIVIAIVIFVAISQVI